MTDTFEWDPKLAGFGKRIRDGRATWVIQFRLGHQQRRMTLGSAEKLSQAQARDQAGKRLAQVELGHDPAGDKQQSRAEARHTLRTVIADYLAAKQERVRPRTYTEVARYLRDHWSALHCVPIKGIKRHDVALELTKMARKHGNASTARARATLSAFFVWAMGEGIADANPVIGTNKPAEGPPRSRVLSDHLELAAIWHACGDDDYGRIVKLLMLTGCRRAEIGGLRRSEIDVDAHLIRLPAERCKNHRAHELPLPDLAWVVLQEALQSSGEHVFGRAGFRSWSHGKEALDQRLGDTVAPWRLHDVRRSVATRMSDIGIMPHVVEAILNHQSGHKAGPAGVYNLSKYQNEVRRALAMWSEHVLALVEGRKSNVVSLHA